MGHASEVSDSCTDQSGLGPASAGVLVQQLVTAVTEIERLQSLLDDATARLMDHFVVFERSLSLDAEQAHCPEQLRSARAHLRSAITTLQFPDMASQLLAHATWRIRFVAQHVSAPPGVQPVLPVNDRPCPVCQQRMDAGTVELF